MRSQATLSALLIACSAAPVLADTIYTVDGDLINEVRIQEDGLLEVTYKTKRSDDSIASDKVVRIEYDRTTELVDTARTAVVEEQYGIAAEDFESYLREVGEEGDKRYSWAPAYAMWRLAELNGLMGNPAGVVKWADRVISDAPNSRFVPMAFLAKAQAQYDSGQADAARTTIANLGELVSGKGLSKRWQLEQELHLVLFDDALKGNQRRSRLEALVATTGDFPTVSNRAYAAVGESLVAAKNFVEAKKVFQNITESPKADGRTLAAAYSGLGECLFNEGSTGSDNAALEAAVLACMRVPVTFPEETRYVPKALFYAGRAYQMMTGEEEDLEEYALRAGKLYVAILRDYPESAWAQQARSFR